MFTDEQLDRYLDFIVEGTLAALKENVFFTALHLRLEDGFDALAVLANLPPMEVRREAFHELGKELESQIKKNVDSRSQSVGAVCMVAETWIVTKVSEDDPRHSLLPSERDDKNEIISVICLSPDGRVCWAKVHFDRDPKDRYIVQGVEKTYLEETSKEGGTQQAHLLEAFYRGYFGHFPVTNTTKKARYK